MCFMQVPRTAASKRKTLPLQKLQKQTNIPNDNGINSNKTHVLKCINLYNS